MLSKHSNNVKVARRPEAWSCPARPDLRSAVVAGQPTRPLRPPLATTTSAPEVVMRARLFGRGRLPVGDRNGQVVGTAVRPRLRAAAVVLASRPRRARRSQPRPGLANPRSPAHPPHPLPFADQPKKLTAARRRPVFSVGCGGPIRGYAGPPSDSPRGRVMPDR
jgi:hypothetical protein